MTFLFLLESALFYMCVYAFFLTKLLCYLLLLQVNGGRTSASL
jgi:hypothetical protein